MSDISIPGVKSKYKTDEIIKNLLEVEKIPLRRMEESIRLYKAQGAAWRELNQGLTKLREAARGLFGFQSPFGERRAVSGDESVLTARAGREAAEGSQDITVRKIASTDSFASRPLDRDFRVPPGTYRFRVGEREARFEFSGGTLSAFVQRLNERGEGFLRAETVPDSPSTQVLLIRSLLPGAANTLSFLGDSPALGELTGMLERDFAGSRSIPVSAVSVRPWTKPLAAGAVDAAAGVLKLRAGEEAFIPLAPSIPLGGSTLLEMDIKVVSRRDEIPAPPQPPPGPALRPPAPTTLGDVTVQSGPSKVTLPEWKAPEPPRIVDDPVMGFVAAGGAPMPLPEFRESADFTRMRLPLAEYGPALTGIYFRNNNTYRDLEVRGIRVYDPSSRGDYRPLNPASTAADAEILMHGVPVRRESNSIDDLIPGVTLELRSPGPSPVSLRVEPDREGIKNSLIQFVGNYNKILAEINILTRRDDSIISEISYLSGEEREKAKEKMGIFQGDLTLMQMRNTFQGIMMNPYPTSRGRELSLLAQIGISTNTRPGGGIDATKLRGYLEINEALLDQGLQTNLPAVRELFGSDSDGDLIPDTGAAVAMDNYIRPLVQTGGILSLKTGGIDSQTAQTTRRIETYNQYLERYEKDLKKKFGAMEGALEGLEKSSQTIDNFNKSGSANR